MLPELITALILSLSPACKTDEAPVIIEDLNGAPALIICHEDQRQQVWKLDSYDWHLIGNRRISKVNTDTH